jgi:hypothetical protein
MDHPGRSGSSRKLAMRLNNIGMSPFGPKRKSGPVTTMSDSRVERTWVRAGGGLSLLTQRGYWRIAQRPTRETLRLERAEVLSITIRNNSLRASAISAGCVGFDSPRVNIDSLRVDIASAADLLSRGGNTRFGAADILLGHAGHSQEWRDESDGKDIFDSHDFSPAFTRKCHWQVTALVALIFIKEA